MAEHGRRRNAANLLAARVRSAEDRLANHLLPPMTPEGQSWFDALRGFAVSCRAAQPLPERAALTAKQEYQCRILGGHLIAWLERFSPPLLKERAFLADLKGWQKAPFIVYLSDVPGLVTAGEILGQEPEGIVYLHREEFNRFLTAQPDPQHLWHVTLESYLTDSSPEAEARGVLTKHPLQAGEQHWVQHDTTVMAPLFARGGQHLFKWDGERITLLEEAFDCWIS